MAKVSELLTAAMGQHQSGQLQAAEQIYRQILQIDPNQPDAIHLLGVIARQVGNPAAAVELITRAIQLKGDVAEFHNNLGGSYLELRRLPEAVSSFRTAVKKRPDYAVAHSNLGNALREQGRHDEAITSCRRALTLKPDFGDAHINLGNSLKDQRLFDEAIVNYRRAIELNPNVVMAHNNLGIALMEQGKLDDAVACFRRAIEINPNFAEAYNNLGNSLSALGTREEAVGSYLRAVTLKPDYAEAHNNLGSVLNRLRHRDEAAACCLRALELKPDYAEAHNNLGNVLKDQGKLEEAIISFRRALDLNPKYADAFSNLGNALQDQGDLESAITAHRRAIELNPNSTVAHSNLLVALQYCEGISLKSLGDAHLEFARQHTTALGGNAVIPVSHRDRLKVAGTLRVPSATSQPGEQVVPDQLRLGVVSADLGRHPVGYFLVRVLENFRRETIETICYSDRIEKDDLTQRLHSAAGAWRDVVGMSDERLARQIQEDRIDILFDLAGHTAHNRMMVFARKPAPIQITWAGYVGTTGLKEMDYIVADRYEIPSDFEQFYPEQVLRMPDGYICYDPPDYAPGVATLPALRSGYVTFGCFNNPAKITCQAIDVWAEILVRVPDSRLVIKYKGWNDHGVVRRVSERFSRSIDPKRIEFLGYSPHAELLAEYNRVDLALDPFPYSGGLTTCEALWMGVPVITCPQETFASRHSLSHLSNVGLTETIARDLGEYVELAVSWASDLPRLSQCRANLRDRMAASPLCDGRRFAANLESKLREVWQQSLVPKLQLGNASL